MDKFLETDNIPILNHQEIENLNRPVISKKPELAMKHQTLKEELMSVLFRLFKKLKGRKGQHFQTRFIRPASPWYQNQRLQKQTNENYRPTSSKEYKCKNP
jgi:hypothetical protein